MLNKNLKYFVLLIILFLSSNSAGQINHTIQLHPDNTHYLLYNNKPTVLITSGEHYGAVLNLDFDYKKYLETMNADGMNYTRIFTGSYVEIPGSFGISNNTLAPEVGKFLSPYKRADEKGLYKGEHKFDISEWDEKYFNRLHDFISLAEELNIVVEVTFFSSNYEDSNWERNPYNPENNINSLDENLNRRKVNTLENGNLIRFQKELVKKIVEELNNYGNVIYEIQNEPWADNAVKVMRILKTHEPQSASGDWFKWVETASTISIDWQKKMTEIIIETEDNLPYKHLLAQNFTNFKYAVETVDSNISIMNFHYAWPEAVLQNYGWEKVIGFDESGFSGCSDTAYLKQAWQFILSGGAIFNNLDYSFFVDKEDGTGVNKATGGGSPKLRKQLKYLREFIESFDFIKMSPDFNIVYHSPGVEWNAISEEGKQYAIILNGNKTEWIKLNLPMGTYHYQILNPFEGEIIQTAYLEVNSDEKVKINLPEFEKLLSIKITEK
ncbi:MAG: hypothetical protein JEY94_01215 [Melioribacteraceae bacterium]|nr:hypothetical protein [Melioribacteraceae bacterium]